MSLEPLADYLKPQFGDIYSCNLHGPDGPGIEVQEWTDELRDAVKHYLLTEVNDEILAALLDWLWLDMGQGDRGQQIDVLIEQVEAHQIAHTLHLIAVVAVPTLDELIGSRSSWSGDGLQDDVVEWLDANASSEQVRELTQIVGLSKLIAAVPWYTSEPSGEHFTRPLEPPDLLAIWHWAVGPADSDLTDEEWRLLLPFVEKQAVGATSRPRTENELLSLHRALDGIRYRFRRGVPWTRIPSRYGTWLNLRQRHRNYRQRGEFHRMLRALRGQPGAERVVKWLETMVAG